MFTLTLEGPEERRELRLNDEKVTIGAGDESLLQLPIAELEGHTLTLHRDGTTGQITNTSNCPAASLNGEPFEQAPLTGGDLLIIGDWRITITITPVNISESELQSIELDDEIDIDAELAKLEASGFAELSQGLEELDVDALAAEVEKLEEENKKREEELQPAEAEEPQEEEKPELTLHPEDTLDPLLTQEKQQLKTEEEKADEPVLDAFHEEAEELDHQEDITIKHSIEDDVERVEDRRKLTTALAVVAAMVFILSVGGFLAIKRHHNHQELMAAQAIADVSMALQQAWATKSVPQDDDWNDTEFLTDQLEQLLTSKSMAETSLHPNRTIVNGNYSLMVSMNDEANRFIVAALPKSGLLELLGRKKALFTDSESMQIWRTSATIYLSTTGKQLTEDEAIDLPGLWARGQSLPLKSFDLQGSGFQPPKSLATYLPGAEQRIHNAPRYYRFTQPLVELAANLDGQPLERHDIEKVQQLFAEFHNLPDLILYSPGGMQNASSAYNLLSKVVAESNPLLAYISFDANAGRISNAYLLTDELRLEALSQMAQQQDREQKPLQQHPSYPTFKEIAQNRKQAVEAASNELITLLQHQANHPTANYHTLYWQKAQDYQAEEQLQTRKAEKRLKELFQSWEDSDQNTQEFLLLAEEFGLTELAEKISNPEKKQHSMSFEELLHQVATANTIETLHQAVLDITPCLDPDEEDDLLAHKKQIGNFRQATLERVSSLLFSPLDPSVSYTRRDRARLAQILTDAGVTQAEERDYYLNEFDYLIERLPPDTTDDQMVRLANQTQASQIPIGEMIVSTASDEPQMYGRLGQQMIASEKNERPSDQRDDKLLQAIQLLSEATQENRTYWLDILQARWMRSDSPRQKLHALLTVVDQKAESDQIEERLKQYFFQARGLDNSQNKKNFIQQHKELVRLQTKELQKAFTTASEMRQRAIELERNFNHYITRLEEYLEDFQLARDEGFFATNAQEHPRTMAQLNRSLQNCHFLQSEVKKVSKEIQSASKEYEQITRSAMAQLENPEQLTKKQTHELIKRVENVHLPIDAYEKLVHNLEPLLTVELLPTLG